MMKKFMLRSIMKLLGRDYSEYYKILDNLKIEEEMMEFRNTQLKNILIHAISHVPYYSRFVETEELFKEGEIDLSHFSRLPLLNKDIIRNQFTNLISKDYTYRGYYLNSSGGSTGEPTKIIQDTQYLKWGDAVSYYYYHNILGIEEPTVRKVLIWGSDRDLFKGTVGWKLKLYYWLSNQKVLNSFKMTEENMEYFISEINNFQPLLIRGYAGSLYELSRYIEKNDVTIFKPDCLVSAAETLNDDMRACIERVFQQKVYNYYGSREVGCIAGECPDGLMHMLMSNYIEILDHENNPVQEGQEGKVVVTTLFNYSMPLIRYEIGDTAISGPKTCSCTNKLPTLCRVTGRIIDHFVSEEGTIVPGEYFIHLIGVVYNQGIIQQFQVIQDSPTNIRIRVVLQKEMDNVYKNEVETKIRLVMGKNCIITWERVKEIEKTITGKYVYTRSNV
jgi:phenylacetate-CoA ligase